MTILETIPIFKQPGTYASLVFFSFIGAILFLIIAFALDDYTLSSSIFFILFVISGVICIIGILLSIAEPAIDTGKVKYIVRIDDTYSINEFYEKYEILEHTKYTDVYTVKELEND